jgi:hypothetical protein
MIIIFSDLNQFREKIAIFFQLPNVKIIIVSKK